MELQELLKQRRACHHFVPGFTIPDQDLIEMVEQAGLSPSGYNSQPWEFLIIRTPENIAKMHRIAFSQEHVQDASAIIIVLGDTIIGRNIDQVTADWLAHGYLKPEKEADFRNSLGKNRPERKRREMALRNASMAAMNLILAAENMGYATCPMMGFSHKELEAAFHIPEDRIVTLMIALGKADLNKQLPRLPRKPTENLIHWESC